MKTVELKLDQIIPYENNPRFNDGAVDAVAKSIDEFGFQQPLVLDKDNIIIVGHTRYKAAQKLGLETVPCVIADNLTEEQVKAYRLADNKVGELALWDDEKLNIELDDILEIDMSQFGFDLDFGIDEEPQQDVEESVSLSDKFIVPPFSVFDTRQGYWQDRKREWKSLGIKSEVGRKENLMNSPDLPEYATYGGSLKGVAPQTSIFDPVLCEIMYKWFNVDGGKIYDCFAGGSVRGIVAAQLGYDYKGIDLRQEQIDANYQNASDLGLNVEWYCDDSLNADKYVQDESVDLVFSCPPYADLEVYSDDPRDISNMDYEDFIKTYNEIIRIALNKLKNDRFAVFVVGDVRDKNGFYYDFISDTKKAFIDCGCKLYNEIILVEQIGTGAMRAGKTFTAGRKVVKVHQNVLVFYKGDPKNIKHNYTAINVEDIIAEAIE